MNRMVVNNLANPDGVDFILVMLDSHFVVSDMNYTASNSILFRVRTSSIDITDIRFDMILNATKLGEVTDCYNTTINGLHSINTQITGDHLFIVEESNNMTLVNVHIFNSHSDVILIRSSNVTSIDDIEIRNCTEGFIIQSSTINMIENSVFDQNGESQLLVGGAIRIIDSSVLIQNTNFTNNIAYSGGAVYFTCTSTTLCSLELDMNEFNHNTATENGGAIFYDYVRPTFNSSTTFMNNSAQYGPDIASYAVKITFESDPDSPLKIDNVGSGITYPQTLKFAVRDYDNQIMNLNSQDQIIMSATNSTTTQVRGFNAAALRNGVAEFDNFIVVAKPGSQNIEVTSSSNAIDQAKIQAIFGSPISSNIIITNLRLCQPGELLEGDSCRECSPGTYSLEWSSPTCHDCMEDVVCEGGTQISVNSGFWRQDLNSTSIIECENKDACAGGYTNEFTHPTSCAAGYTGNLCTKCEITDDDKYQEIGNFQCQKCPNPIVNAVRVLAVGLAVFVFFMIIIGVNVRKTSESSMSILLRILTNYAQIITSTLSFSSSHPDLLGDALVPVENVGDSSTAFMSFDCFITDYEVKGPFPSNAYFKLFLLIFLPILVFGLVAMIWLVAYMIKRSWIPDMQRYLIISFISVVFLLHPKLAQSGIDVFRCLEINDGNYKVRIDSDMD